MYIKSFLEILSFLFLMLIPQDVFCETQKCPKGQVYKKCAYGCSKKCGFWYDKNVSCKSRKYCQSGCDCPDGKYMTWDMKLNRKCVSSSRRCYCPDGQVYNMEASICTATCNNPYPMSDSKCKKTIARCACPEERPIWHKGRCIKFDKCICSAKGRMNSCYECNQCSCNGGRLGGCTEIGCPNAKTKAGARDLARGGCYRQSATGMCIYFNPCPKKDTDKPEPCTTVGYENCANQNKKCMQDMTKRILSGEGGWGKVKGVCTFMVPGPESGDFSCQKKKSGTASCDQCNVCECIYGVKVCSKKVCPRPLRGCTRERSYFGEQPKCRWTSPCLGGGGEKLCNFLFWQREVIPKEGGFCYRYNSARKICEYVRPCPDKCRGDEVCNDCNKCKCKNGKVDCQKGMCGNPIKLGCWTKHSGMCLFTSPCPWDSYGHQCSPKKKTTYEEMLDEGCWSPMDRKCTFFYPCPY